MRSPFSKLLMMAPCFAGLLFLAGDAFSFHDQGVAACEACHIMHNSQDGVMVDPSAPDGNTMLLRFGNSTEVCLSCHADAYGAVLGADPVNPPPEMGAGNFTYLLEDNINDDPSGMATPIPGSHAGHNVVSASYGIPVDPDYAVAPGGIYPASELSCTSCHDPHGNENFRMLYGAGLVSADRYTFIYPAPLAQGVDLVLGQESPASHTAYNSGWANWCANCHGLYHDGAMGQVFEHPAEHAMGTDYSNAYNQYNGPSDPAGGDYLTAYIVEVPLEDPALTIDSAVGSTASSRVMCMSCHRAHATSAPGATRWDPNVLTLGEDGVASGSYPLTNPYIDPTQRALCVKCHYDDAVGHGWSRPCMDCHAQGHHGGGATPVIIGP